MGQLTLTVKYRKNEGLLFSPAEIFSIYLYGIKIQAGDGTAFSQESMRFYIQAAQKEIENFFNLKLVRQFISLEKLTFYRADYWQSFPYLPSTILPRISSYQYLQRPLRHSRRIYPNDFNMYLSSRLIITHPILFHRRPISI